MKCNQTILIEKYSIDQTIKTKTIRSKQVSIIKEEINISKNTNESPFKDAKADKKKIIQIIQSFEDSTSPDKLTSENLSFISDIKTSDSQFINHLKFEHDSIKSDYICNTFLNSKNINNDINILDFNKNCFIEPLLNDYNKNIKIIRNDFFNNINNITNTINENILNEHHIENEDDNKDETQNKNEKISKNGEKNDDDEGTVTKKMKIIIKSLIYFNKDDNIDGIENFQKRIPDYNKSQYEEDNKFEKNVYIRIEDRIREYLNKYKCDKLSQLRDFENSYLLKIKNFQKKSPVYKNISIKGIIIGLLNIINDYVGKEYMKISQEKIKNNNYEKGEYFLDLYEKYEIMKKFCVLLEKDFILLIENFKEEIKFGFSFENFFCDIYWDYVFRIKELNIYFTNNYNNEKISKKANEAMDNIIDILLNIDLPYKKIIGEMLDISCIKKENIYLMDYIIKYKTISTQKNNNNINSNNNNENDNNKNNENNNIDKENNNEIKKDTKLYVHGSSSCDKILNNKNNNNIIEEDNNKKYNEEDNKNKNNNEDNNSINVISEDVSTNDYNAINNSISNDNDEKKNDLNLGKSLSMDICNTNNKLSDKDSLEKVYNYILYGENENDKKKQKKRHKKRRKNKNNNSLVIEENEIEESIDPVVEEYKNYINDINKNCTEYVKKIKPKIKEEWINHISTSIDE